MTGGIDKVELVSEELSEDGKSARVTTKITYGDGEQVGPTCLALYNRLQDIQYGRAEDKFGWTIEIE